MIFESKSGALQCKGWGPVDDHDIALNLTELQNLTMVYGAQITTVRWGNCNLAIVWGPHIVDMFLGSLIPMKYGDIDHRP